MKTNLLALATGLFCVANHVTAQTNACAFVSPTVEINNTGVGVGNSCVVNMDLSFVINTNNGNKFTVLHLWSLNDYPNPTFPYALNNEPKSSQNGGNGALDNALLTVAIDRDAVTFLGSYSPDPSIDDNIAPAINQYKNAADGLTLSITPLGNNNYYYKIGNVTVTYPGACTSLIQFRGDAWSSNAAALNVQCSMTGFTYLSNAPIISPAINCNPDPQPNTYSFTVGINAPNFEVDYSIDIYADVDNNGEYDPQVDNILIHSYDTASLPNVTSTSTYFHPSTSYSYSATVPNKYKDLFFIAGNIHVKDINTNQVTQYSNTIVLSQNNNCLKVLPVELVGFNANRAGNSVALHWKYNETQMVKEYEIQRAGINKNWETVGKVAAKNSGMEEAYSFNDNNASLATTYYRIKIVNPNGEESYSKVLSVAGAKENLVYNIAPNPAIGGTIHLQLSTNKITASIKVFDLQGRVMKQIVEAASGTYDIAGLAPGVYLVAVSSADGAQSNIQKVIVQ